MQHSGLLSKTSAGGSRLHGPCQRFWLARGVPSGVGGTRPPRLVPGGENGKRGDQRSSSLPQALICWG